MVLFNLTAQKILLPNTVLFPLLQILKIFSNFHTILLKITEGMH